MYQSLVVAASLLVLSASVRAEDAVSSLRAVRHTISASPAPTNHKLAFKAELLPTGARGKFASYDGDNFIVNFPPAVSGAMSADAVFANVVTPLMRAMGFGDQIGDMRSGSQAPNGVVLPGANLAAVADHVCRDLAGPQPVCDAMKHGETNADADRALSLAFATSFVQVKADAERKRVQYVYRQFAEGLPIEHTMIIAERAEGETVTVVSGRILNRYRVTRVVKRTADQAYESGTAQLLSRGGLVDAKIPRGPTELVLLPDGGADVTDGAQVVAALLHAYRTVLYARRAPLAGSAPGELLSWTAWIDAEFGHVLQLAPEFAADSSVKAEGRAWLREPHPVTAQTRQGVLSFRVDPAAKLDPAGTEKRFVLKRDGVFLRLDRFGDADFNDAEVALVGDGFLANFNIAPFNNWNMAFCKNSGNDTFRQVNAYAHLHAFREQVVGAGTLPSFPERAITIKTDMQDPAGEGNFAVYGTQLLNFVVGDAYTDLTGCPTKGVLPGVTDATTMGHEFAHLAAMRLGLKRPADWCGAAPCPAIAAESRDIFHDFADAWAHAYADTPCQAGWSRKNTGGPDASWRCRQHNEGGGLPRKASVDEPFTGLSIQDHFPEKRSGLVAGAVDYKDGQIAAAGLWLTRQGLRSKSLPAGAAQHWIRFHRAVYRYGVTGPSCVGCDRDVYRYAQEFIHELMAQWILSSRDASCPPQVSSHTANKLLSAWARVGIFLTPADCIDGSAATTNPTACAGGEDGGDAIIDVFDLVDTDDPQLDDIVVPEEDYLQRLGKPPRFRVWTGPAYTFSAAGVASVTSPCNGEFKIELSNAEPFPLSATVASDWLPHTNCYGTWDVPQKVWDGLKGAQGDVRVYYRVRTRRNALATVEKVSTRPGNGAYVIQPPYVVVNPLGRP